MRTLTKTGIRVLTKRYRSVLKKCAILNAMVLMLGTSSAMAADVNTWSGLKDAVGNTEVTTINVTGDITYDGTVGTISTISRTLSIIGYDTEIGDTANRILGGKFSNDSQTKGLVVNGGNLTLQNITMQNFKSTSYGGAIYNNGSSSKITNIIGNFSHNSALSGGAIYNYNGGEISNIAGDFESNSATSDGGAIGNFGNLSKIGNIAGDFIGNHVDGQGSNAGAIYNGGTIGNSDGTGGITGDFENNSATNWGGAIYNTGTINKVTGNFTKNSAAKNGGAVYNGKTINFVAENGKNITFSGNYVTNESDDGGAIYNTTTGTVGLYASADHSITFTGDTTGLPSTANNVDSIYNLKILNINGDGTITPYTGTVNLYKVIDNSTPAGTTNIYGGQVNVKDAFTQKDLNLKAGTFSLGKGGTVTNLNAEGGALSMSIADASYVNTVDTLTVKELKGDLTSFGVDYDATLSTDSNMDKIAIETGTQTGSVKLTSVNVIRDAEATAETLADGKFLDGTFGNITDNTETTSTTTSGGWKYTFTPSSKGVVSVTRAAVEETLAQVIQNATGSSSYSINTNPYTTNENLGSLAGDGRNFTIYGNGNTIDGNGTYAGITVNNGQTLTLDKVNMQNFKNTGNGGAIYNEDGKITGITGDFKGNHVTSGSGGAIYNFKHNVNTEITSISGKFSGNSAQGGGAIYNISGGEIGNISGDFEDNFATDTYGGAISNFNGSSKIGNIAGNFKGNHADGTSSLGGAIYNSGIIDSITGNFENNYTASTTYGGGAIANTKTINISTSDEKSTILFTGNYITNSSGKGGAISNMAGTLGLYAKGANDTITFVGGADDTTNNKYDIDGIYNQATLNINGFENESGAITKYNGTVNLYNVSDAATAKGTTNIYGGTVNATKDITQNNINVLSGATLSSTGNIKVTETLTNNGTVNVYGIKGEIQNNAGGSLTFNDTTEIVDINLTNSGTVNFNGQLNVPNFGFILTQNAGTMNFSTTAIETTAEYGKINTFTMNGGSVNIADGNVNTLHINQLNLTGNTNFAIDADLAAESMDKIKVNDIDNSSITEGKMININKINLLSATEEDKVSLDLFANDATKNALINNVNANINGLQYSPTYIYDAKYSTDDGKITFTRTEQANPYLYVPSTMAQTTANMTGQIAGLAMDKLDAAVTDSEKGLAAGDMPKASNAWVKVMGFDDDVDFKHFNSIDSKAYTIAGGFNTDKVQFNDVNAAFGIYGGYIGGRQKYTENKIEQKGGYVGLSSELTKGNAFLLSTIDTGFINNESENMYGTDKFDTRWFGIGLKGGYNYALTDSWTLQPNVYAGYTLVNTEDYTSKSGVRINNDNLNFFEIDPGFKLSKQIDNGWLGYIQGKYAIVMDNGGETTFNDIVLPNISAKNYFEYGFGMNKSLTDAWSLNGEINRRDGGRSGWNGSIEFKYNF